jgi:DNA-binding GntR family transcriptional regulator
MSKPFTPGGKAAGVKSRRLEPLTETLQLGTRAYRALAAGIVDGQIEPGTQLRPEAIAEQLEISATPVREALHRLEGDGLLVKLPYQGWFVREFTEQEVRQLYEMRAAMECFGVRLACQRMTQDELRWLRDHQAVGQRALEHDDIDAYRIYNRDLHAAIIKAARNSYLSSVMGQLSLQSQMLMGRTIRLVGRPSRAIEEHNDLIELIGKRQEREAARLMERHILSALEDIVRFAIGDPVAAPRRVVKSPPRVLESEAD